MNSSTFSCPDADGFPELGHRTPLHRRGAFYRTVGVLFTLLGCALLAGGLWLCTALPGAMSDAEDYRAATPCAPDSRPGPAEDCLRQYPATVAEVHLGARNDPGYVAFSHSALRLGRVEYRGEDDDAAAHWRPGDHATISVWRDRVVAMTVGDHRLGVTDVDHGELFFATGALLGLTFGGALLYCGVLRLGRTTGLGCTANPKADVLHPVVLTAGCWILLTLLVTSVLGLPVQAGVPFWLTGLAFTVRAAGRAVYRHRLGARPGRDPAVFSLRLDRLFGAEGILLPWQRHGGRTESAALARGERVEFAGLLPGDARYSPAHSPVNTLALENGSLYAAPSTGMGKLARRIPLEEYRLSDVRLLHLTPTDRWGKRAYARNLQLAQLARGDERLSIVTDPHHLRRILELLPERPAPAPAV